MPFRGYKQSKEHKDKLIEYRKKQRHTDKTKEKIRQYRKNWKPTDEFRKKMSIIMGGDGIHKSKNYPFSWTMSLKRSIRERDNYICRLCGKQQDDIVFHIHHIDYNKQNCNPENLITLCKSCHTKTNRNRKLWIDIFKKIIS